MPDDPVANKAFFLTRQTANLMEDFARETSQSSSVYLLYGDASVGKSRVLDELASRHFSGNSIHRIDFNTEIDRKEERNESAVGNSNEMAGKIQRVIQNASDHDIIIADHFESASNKTRHQIFQSWAIDGLDKKLNLIIAADSSHFDEVRQLAKQYQVSVKSFELKSFGWDDIEAFVSFYLFSKESPGRLSIPGDIQKQLKQSRGLVGKLIEIVSSGGVDTAIKIDDKAATFKKPLILAGILSLILLLVSLLYILSDQQTVPPLEVSNSDIIETPETEQKLPAVLQDESVPKQSIVDRSISENAREPVIPESDLVVPERPIESALENSQEIVIIRQDDNANEAELISVNNGERETEPTDDSDQALSRFQKELNNSLTWIKNRDKNQATIQIMSIGFDGFADNTYYDYLDKLIQQGVNVSQVRIFQTRITGLVVYSVIFGEYKNRREASKSIALLPEALNANKPIPRSIGGIWDELFLNQ